MENLLVGITKTLSEPNCLEELTTVINIVESKPEVELLQITESIDEMEDCKEAFLNMIDIVDVMVVCLSEVSLSAVAALSWMMGYCWSQGVPVALVSLKEHIQAADLGLAGNTPIAYLNSKEELLAYDFKEVAYLQA